MLKLKELNNVPCRITIGRAVSVIFIIPLWKYGCAECAFSIAVVAYLTDAIDGWYARKYGEETLTGRIIDPIADKILFYPIIFILFNQEISIWISITALALDLISTFLRSFMQDGSNRYGKWKTRFHTATVAILGLNGMEWSNSIVSSYEPVGLANNLMIISILLASISLVIRVAKKAGYAF